MHWSLLLLTLASLYDASWTWLLARQTPWALTNAPYWQLVAGHPWEVQAHEAVYYPQLVTVVDRSRVIGADGNVTFFDISDSRMDEQPVAGPSPLGNDPLSRPRLIRRAAENEDRRVVLWRVCGFQQPNGQVTFEAIWTTCPAINSRLWFDDGSVGASAERARHERDGFELVHLCGYIVDGAILFVGVWHKSVTAASRITPNVVAYNVSLGTCQRLDGEYRKNGSNLVSFQAFNAPTGEVLCSAVWRYGAGRAVIQIGESLTNITRAIEQADPQGALQPSHISAFDRGARIAVLFASAGRQLQCPVSPESIWANVVNAQIPRRQSVNGSNSPAKVMTLVENRVGNFMRKHNIPSVAIAMSSREQLKLDIAFGLSKVSGNEPATPTTLYRIGDISKSFTSVSIFLLIEAKRLSLQDVVFGSTGILGTRFGTRPYSDVVQAIRLRHVLEHTMGGWGQSSGNPIFLSPELNNSALIGFALDNIPLQNSPGTVWDFSHFGYLLLGAVIEQVSGLSYERFVHERVLLPCDIQRMKVTAQWASGRKDGEAMYYMGGGGQPVDVYDYSTPERMASVAGWIASPADLLRFMARVDGSTIIDDLLRPETLAEMYAASNASNGRHAKGWRVDQFGFNGLMHMGIYPGAKSLLIRTDFGVALALLMNRVGDDADFDADVIALAHSLTDVLEEWGAEDLFGDHAGLAPSPPVLCLLLSLLALTTIVCRHD